MHQKAERLMEQAEQVLDKALRMKPNPLLRALLRFVRENH